MNRILSLIINDKNIIIQKEGDRYISDRDIKEVIEDLITNNLELPTNKLIDLSNICDLMFSIVYKGIVKTIENINNKDVSIDNIVFEVC